MAALHEALAGTARCEGTRLAAIASAGRVKERRVEAAKEPRSKPRGLSRADARGVRPTEAGYFVGAK